MIRRFAIALALGALSSGGALASAGEACAPETRDRASTLAGEACAVTHFHAPTGTEGLAPVENIWLGYVLQVFHETDGCLVGEAQVVVDCAHGDAYSFAPAGEALMAPAALEAAKAGAYGTLVAFNREAGWDHSEVVGWDRASALRVVDLGPVTEGPVALGSNGQAYDLSCGCKHLAIGPVGNEGAESTGQ